MAFKFFSFSHVMSEKLRDSLYLFFRAFLCFQPISKTTMPIPKVEWSLYKAAHLPTMPGKSHPNKEITRNIFFRYKKVQFIHPELVSLRCWGSPLRLQRLLLSGKISSQLELGTCWSGALIDSHPHAELQCFWFPALRTGKAGSPTAFTHRVNPRKFTGMSCANSLMKISL